MSETMDNVPSKSQEEEAPEDNNLDGSEKITDQTAQEEVDQIMAKGELQVESETAPEQALEDTEEASAEDEPTAEQVDTEALEAAGAAAAEQAMEKLEAAYAESEGAGTEENPDQDVEAAEDGEITPEMQDYIDEAEARMEEEVEGTNLNKNKADAKEKPKKTALGKAMVIATAAVMIWMASAAAAPDTAQAKNKGFGVADVFKKQGKKLKKIPGKAAKDITKGVTKEISKGINNGVKDILGGIFK